MKKNDSVSGQKIYELNSEIRHLENCLSIIESFNLRLNPHTMYLDKNILIVEGNAGCGKSHLLGYIADKTKEEPNTNCLLFLGQKLIGNNKPQNQMVDSIDYEFSFESLLECLENIGEYDGSITVIMIDAINESKNNEIWKQYINELTFLIEKYKYIKLILSVRTTYKEYVFNKAFLNRISNGEIPIVTLNGFRYNLVEAISLFFNHYHIPLTIDINFNRNLENPMFLKLYCIASQNGEQYGCNNMMNIYYNYIKGEENRIKEEESIINNKFIGKEIFKKIGKYFYDNAVTNIPYYTLIEICEKIPYSNKLIDGFIRSKVLIEYLDKNGDPIIYICYEKLCDYILANYILELKDGKDDIDKYISNIFFDINGKMFNRHNSIGVFAALSVIYNEKYKSELIKLLPKDINTQKEKNVLYEYIEHYSYRENKYIDSKSFCEYVLPLIKKTNDRKLFFELLFKFSTRDCSLNSNYLFALLSKMSMPDRDYFWTTYINECYYEDNLLFDIIMFYCKSDLSKFNENEIKLSLQFLILFLTSSNRELRDNVSRVITKILKDNISLIQWSLNRFKDINDPYIISRLYGCCYGALLQCESHCDENYLKELASFIRDTIFSNYGKYCDILLRDYALNILEYINNVYKIDIDYIENCKPPYSNIDIPDIDIMELKELYDNNKVLDGFEKIKWSLAPDFKIKDFTSSYGDFGRYTFQYALSNFKNVEKQKIFKYAYYYIIKTLGYNDKLSYYDKFKGYGRDRTNAIERIGKKYQWIAMYHILAIVCDKYKYSETYSDHQFNKYQGSWRPNFRDFDPTLSLKNSERKYYLPFKINLDEYTNWDISNEKWAYVDDVNNFKNNIFVVDSNKDKWIALYFNENKRKEDYEYKIYQSVWKSSSACLIKLEDKYSFIEAIKNKSLYGRWLYAAESRRVDNLFLREYYWSPSCKDEFEGSGFQKVELQMVEKDPPIFDNIGSLSVCHVNYLWEEENDYSKDEVISIHLPSKNIVKILSLHQKEDGVWYDERGEICCVDISFVKNSNVNGLYLKEKYLKVIRSNGFDIVWIGLGEKRSGDLRFAKSYGFNEISSLVYFDNNEKKEIIITNHK